MYMRSACIVTHMPRILQTKPPPHGGARNPQVGIMDPSLEAHTDKLNTARRVQVTAAVSAEQSVFI